MKHPVDIEDVHARKICRAGQGERTCSYLQMSRGWVCYKNSNLHHLIERRRQENEIVAMGDHCSGPPHFTLANPGKED